MASMLQVISANQIRNRGSHTQTRWVCTPQVLRVRIVGPTVRHTRSAGIGAVIMVLSSVGVVFVLEVFWQVGQV